MLHDVCIAKSGTITQSRMRVHQYHAMDRPEEVIPCGDNFFQDGDLLRNLA